jgi:multidrug efflux pump subunit AcrB
LNLPAGYEMEFGGEFAERNEAVGRLSASLGVLAVVMAATLVLSFGSFRLAAIIAVVAGTSAGLGFGSLWLFGYPFGFMAIVGTMGLIGVAINDSIVVLAALREDELARIGHPRAIRDVIVRSSRHIFATTFTTIAGFLPLIMEGGGFWPPLAITIAGGVAGATLLALVFVPSSYMLVNRVRQAEPAAQPQTVTSPVEFPALAVELVTA